MAQSDGSDLLAEKRHRLLALQPELRDAYPHALPAGTLLFRCRTCQRTYPLTHFARNDQRRYGIRPDCRACRAATRPRDLHDPDPEQTHKVCPVCHRRRRVAAFSLSRHQPDGYAPACRDCAKARKQAHADARHHDRVAVHRRERTIQLCATLGIDVPDHDLKRCTRCREVKPIDEFVNDWTRADRKKSICLDCHG